MKRSPRVPLSAAVKRSLLSLSVLSLALLLLGSPALATTPIAVDLYQDMESGNAGDVLTSSIMNASSHGQSGWSPVTGTMWVSTAYHHDLGGPVLCGGVTYNGTGGSRSWRFSDTYAMNCVQANFGSYSEITVACFYTTGITLTSWTHGYDNIIMWGNSSFACFQTLLNSDGWPGLAFHCHSKAGISTNQDPLAVSATAFKTYWVSMNYSSSVAQVVMAAFDPDNGYAQTGTTLYISSTYGDSDHMMWFGRGDNHGDQTNDLSSSYFDQIMFDHTNAAFPLLPSGANDSSAPGAPPVVRDGTGTDQSIALSTTQLSANWDMAVDAQSGIKGYQYAIGTSQGGTNVTNWTTLINKRGVTQTGLSLTTGQTYYFSVKAINGVGLVGPAANSNGQTVGTDSTAPSAPPAVRDGGAYNYSADIDSQTDASDLYCNFDFAADSESGISCYQYAFGTTPGGTNVINWTTSPANVMNAWANNLTLTQGQRYYASVKAINNAGITGPATNSNGVTIGTSSDTTPPSAPPAVRDGTGADISTTSSTTQLSANWDASTDSQSGINGYQYAIGTSAGGTQTVNWTSLGNVLTVTKTGLTLTVGQTYYFSIKAINGAGLTGSATNSNGQTVVSAGNNPPSAPANVRDGTGTDISTTSSTTQLSANWDASTDSDGSVTAYQYAIGTTAGGTQTVNWTTLGNVTTVTKTGLSLANGQTYYFSVKAVDNLGLAGSATNSNGQTVQSGGFTTYFSDRFEDWTVHGGAWSSVSGETATQTLNTSTDHVAGGFKSLKLTDTDTTATYGACLVKNFSPTISGGIYVRFYINIPTGYTAANTGGAARRLLRVFCGSNRGQMSLAGATPLMEEIGAWGASQASSALNESTWHYIEMYMASPSASTAMQFWIDGTSAGTLNGSFSGSSSYDRMEFGDVCVGSGTNCTGTFYLDEVIVSNAYNGPLQ